MEVGGGATVAANAVKILVVEDDPVTRVQVEAILRVEGYQTQQASNGAAGLEKAKIQSPDIIISDIEMPEMTGPELCAQVRAIDRLRSAYIIMLTSRGDRDAKLEALRAGADDFIVKPARPGELLSRVEIAIRILAAERKVQDVAKESGALVLVVRTLRGELEAISRSLTAAEIAAGKGSGGTVQEAIDSARAVIERALRTTASAPGREG
jgi:DNA-binding response OmpR family regulator